MMVFIQSFECRPPIFNWALLLLLWGGIFAAWQLAAPAVATPAALIFAAAALLDLLVLWLLPRLNISFGPVAPQLLTMLLPRIAAAFLALLIAFWQPVAALWIMLLLQLLGSAAYLWGLLIEARRLRLTSLDVSVSGFPAGAPPIRLLHLSDIHLERLTQRENRLLQLIQSARPDLIVITGDYLNLSYNNDPKAIAQVRN
jgi:small-conductance mechanosensitive channel